MEWKDDAINVWFFPANAVPESLQSGSTERPDTSTFGKPSASFTGPCSKKFSEKFFNHTLVLDTTFCGGWAGGSYGAQGSQCPTVEGATPHESCVDFVSKNPEAFKDAFWDIRS